MAVRIGDDEVAQAQLPEQAVRPLQREPLGHRRRARVHVQRQIKHRLQRPAPGWPAVNAAALRGKDRLKQVITSAKQAQRPAGDAAAPWVRTRSSRMHDSSSVPV